MSTAEINGAPKAARDWDPALASYRRPSAARGLFELAVTLLPFVAIWAAMLIAARHGQVWLSLAPAPLAAVLLVRLFMIQHDCGHGSFLPSKAANEWIGRGIGIVTMTPTITGGDAMRSTMQRLVISNGAASATSRR
jgi:acyl-lipid omega-6 desaturase (Delta-12 desaturase)